MKPNEPDTIKSLVNKTTVFLAIYTLVGTPLLLVAIGLCEEGTTESCGPRAAVNAAAVGVIAYTVLQWVLFTSFRKKQNKTGMRVLILIPLSLIVLLIILTNFF